MNTVPEDDIGTQSVPVRRYSVLEAAAILGIKERAVRKRIAAGSLKAQREGKKWWVLLPGNGESRQTVSADNGTESHLYRQQEGRPAAGPMPRAAGGAELERYQIELEAKEQEIAELRDRVSRYELAFGRTRSADYPSEAGDAEDASPERSVSSAWRWQASEGFGADRDLRAPAVFICGVALSTAVALILNRNFLVFMVLLALTTAATAVVQQGWFKLPRLKR